MKDDIDDNNSADKLPLLNYLIFCNNYHSTSSVPLIQDGDRLQDH